MKKRKCPRFAWLGAGFASWVCAYLAPDVCGFGYHGCFAALTALKPGC